MTHLKHILISCILACIVWNGHAQVPRNMDMDISYAIPHFNCPADEYLQYLPAGAMLGLKVCGYESRTGWGQMIVSDVFSVAIMAGVTKGIKYAVDRTRPDGGRHSFPSGHTATAFMAATMLHKEYGWRSPWWSIGGYTVAAFTGVSRLMNNRHWMSDVAAGAAIGIGSVHLGYWLSDLIFKNSHINPAYDTPRFYFDSEQKHYVAEMYFGRRFVFGKSDNLTPVRGGSTGLSTDIPLIPAVGITARTGANSLTYSDGLTTNFYDVLAGGFYNFHFAKRLELQGKAMAGLVWRPKDRSDIARSSRLGAGLCAGAGLSFMLDENFKVKAYADYESVSSAKNNWMHSVVIGWSAAWLW